MIFLHNVGLHKMPKVKNFRELWRRQKNHRLKQIYISENFVPEIVYNLNQKNDSLKNSIKKQAILYLYEKLLITYLYNFLIMRIFVIIFWKIWLSMQQSSNQIYRIFLNILFLLKKNIHYLISKFHFVKN